MVRISEKKYEMDLHAEATAKRQQQARAILNDMITNSVKNSQCF